MENEFLTTSIADQQNTKTIVVLLGGAPGCGKTTLAKLLSQQ
jgi:uridine kinase